MKLLVNAIALRTGGPLSVLRILVSDINKLDTSVSGVLIVDSRTNDYISSLISNSNFRVLSLSWPNKNWACKLFFEYIWLYFYTLRFSFDSYLSLGDVNSLVSVPNRFTYCHNPSPFMSLRPLDLFFAPGSFLYAVFSKAVLLFNSGNCTSIVQTKWMATALRAFHYRSIHLLAPSIFTHPPSSLYAAPASLDSDFVSFVESLPPFFAIYPCVPRCHKAVEDAIGIVTRSGLPSIQLVLTISGTENRYSRFLYKKYSHVSSIRFFRFLSRDELIHLYSKSSLMIFTSRIETLGLPLYEYMQFMKPILAPNHPYATEALSSYSLAHIYDFSSLSSGADCLRHIAFRSRDSAPAPIAPSPVPDSPDDSLNINAKLEISIMSPHR